jgi:outer membrane protein TolC
MTGPFQKLRLLLVPTLIVAMTGCHPTQPFYLHGGHGNDLQYYMTKAVQTEHPDVEAPPLEEVSQARAPLTLSNPDFQELWDLKLEECVAIALNNSKIIRGGIAARLQNGTLFAGGGEGTISQNPQSVSTIYNPSIVESHPGNTNLALTPDGGQNFARQGVEAALAEFDAQLRVAGGNNAGQSGPFLTKSDRPQNVAPGFGGFPSNLQLTQGAATAELSKKILSGGSVAVRNSYDYDRGNQRGTFQALNSTWTTTFEVEARHPLLQNNGTQINRIPVIIARISTDVELMNLQSQLNEMLCNIEVRYWDLHLSYRTLETAKLGRDSALRSWRSEAAKREQDREAGAAESQAREQYYTFRAQVETSLRELYNNEGELRLLMGLGPTDGRLIRPIDEPTLARVEFEWCDALQEAINRRPELISKRWQLKQREMELILARNRLLPQLDVGALYRWVGVGDQLIDANRGGANFPNPGSTAFEELTEGNYQEAVFFGQFAMPIGFRRELAGVRHFQLRLAREKALLEEMELDITHGLTKSVRNLDAAYQLVQTNANRWAASSREVQALEDAFGKRTEIQLDQVLEAHRRRATAQNAFWNSVVEYNKSIADVHCRKASILDYNGVAFEEGPWPSKAYWDAQGHARERDASHFLDYGWTRPKVVSRGPVPPAAGMSSLRMENLSEVVGGAAAEDRREELPGVEPQPTPAGEQPPPQVEEPASPLPAPADRPPAEFAPEQNDPNLRALPEAKARTNFKSAAGNPLRGARGTKSDVRLTQHQEPIPRGDSESHSTNQSDRSPPRFAPGGTGTQR